MLLRISKHPASRVEELTPRVWKDTVTDQRRCWVQKTANMRNKVPKAVQPKMKETLQDIWIAESRSSACQGYEASTARFDAKCPKAMAVCCHCIHHNCGYILSFVPSVRWSITNNND